MKTFYYDIDNSRFLDSAGDWIPQCVPELFYQEHAEWKIVLRDGGNAPVDFSRIAVWGAAVADDFRTDTAPMCRTQNEGIAADTNSGEVTVSLDCATEEFLACVTGASEKAVRFELYGLDSSGRRLINIGFDIRVRMTLDPDPGIDVHTPDTVATKAFVSAYVHQSGAITSGAEIDTTVGGYRLTYTSSGGLLVSGGGVALQVSSGGIIASGASGERMVMSGGQIYGVVKDGNENGATFVADTGGIALNMTGDAHSRSLRVNEDSVQINGEDWGTQWGAPRPVLTELVTATDSETTSAYFDELAGGTSYIYTQPLTALAFGSITSHARAEFDFTAASGAQIGLPSGGGIKLIGQSSLDSGAHYLVAVDGARVVVNSYTIVGE